MKELISNNSLASSYDALLVFRQLLEILVYLKRMRIIHNDIKGNSIADSLPHSIAIGLDGFHYFINATNMCRFVCFLPLDEAIASRAVFVIVSGLD